MFQVLGLQVLSFVADAATALEMQLLLVKSLTRPVFTRILQRIVSFDHNHRYDCSWNLAVRNRPNVY
jgi:hypothetical protein